MKVIFFDISTKVNYFEGSVFSHFLKAQVSAPQPEPTAINYNLVSTYKSFLLSELHNIVYSHNISIMLNNALLNCVFHCFQSVIHHGVFRTLTNIYDEVFLRK